MLRAIRRHPALTVVLVAAVVLRAATMIAYRPILFFADSIDYLHIATVASPVGFSASPHPSGYPLIAELLTAGFRSLTALAAAQHLAGLAIGILVYALLLRLGAPKWLATLGAALVVLDSYLIALEQHLATETLFTLCLTASAYLVIRYAGDRAIAASGLLIAVAATIRPSAVLALPVWLVYVWWARRRPTAVGAGLVAVVLPLLAYSAIHQAERGTFGLSEADGWLLYGRTAELADCGGVDLPRATQSLCRRSGTEALPSPVDYIWTPRSPAWGLFGPPYAGSAAERESKNAELRKFAMAVIRDHPLLYAQLVANDLELVVDDDYPVGPPASLPDDRWRPQVIADISKRHFAGYERPFHPPARALLTYQEVGRTPRWLMAGLAVVGVIALLLSAAMAVFSRGRVRLARSRETFLLLGMGLSVFVGSVAASNADPRFLLTSVPLIVCGGFVAVGDLVPLHRLRLSRPGSSGGVGLSRPAQG